MPVAVVWGAPPQPPPAPREFSRFAEPEICIMPLYYMPLCSSALLKGYLSVVCISVDRHVDRAADYRGCKHPAKLSCILNRVSAFARSAFLFLLVIAKPMPGITSFFPFR